jgi:hypothetical protein
MKVTGAVSLVVSALLLQLVLPACASASTTPKAAGPYTTVDKAEAFVRAQRDFYGFRPDFIDTAQTWRPSATLHVIRATPSATASYGGDHFFFFVNGNSVGRQYFTRAQSEAVLDDATISVTYVAYQAGDPHCCPSGGSHSTRFHWSGTSLIVLDPLTGATQS